MRKFNILYDDSNLNVSNVSDCVKMAKQSYVRVHGARGYIFVGAQLIYGGVTHPVP